MKKQRKASQHNLVQQVKMLIMGYLDNVRLHYPIPFHIIYKVYFSFDRLLKETFIDIFSGWEYLDTSIFKFHGDKDIDDK